MGPQVDRTPPEISSQCPKLKGTPHVVTAPFLPTPPGFPPRPILVTAAAGGGQFHVPETSCHFTSLMPGVGWLSNCSASLTGRPTDHLYSLSNPLPVDLIQQVWDGARWLPGDYCWSGREHKCVGRCKTWDIRAQLKFLNYRECVLGAVGSRRAALGKEKPQGAKAPGLSGDPWEAVQVANDAG